MTIFAVLARESKPELESAVERNYPGDKHFRYADKIWLLSDTGTAREISEKLGVKKGGINGVVVFATTTAYYGVASTALWDWLRARIEGESDG